jgi:hypothetical protein
MKLNHPLSQTTNETVTNYQTKKTNILSDSFHAAKTGMTSPFSEQFNLADFQKIEQVQIHLKKTKSRGGHLFRNSQRLMQEKLAQKSQNFVNGK